jgi:hypothetical protein
MIMGLISGSAMAMTSLPDGSFSGKGEWKDDAGKSGTYTVQTQIKNNVITNAYVIGGQSISFTMEAALDKSGFFPVKVNGAKVGSGYCFDVQCHYSLSTDKGQLEETVTFYQGHMYRLGSKSSGAETVVWQEASDSVN